MASPITSSPSLASTAASSRTVSPVRWGSTTSSTGAAVAQPGRRTNRIALRDYYNLQNPAPVDTNGAKSDSKAKSPTKLPSPTVNSELDTDSFDAEKYVKDVLASERLADIFRIESGLIEEMRGLDGERKALVYDNYSKLITATDTIKRMRERMDPLAPTTSMLAPAVSNIAEIARELMEIGRRRNAVREGAKGEIDEKALKKRKQRDTVRWVLACPSRLSRLLDRDERTKAEEDWGEVKVLLERWEGVRGVEEVKSECERIMAV